MTPERNIEIAGIIASLLAGEITPRQREILDGWLDESPEHRLWYETRVNAEYVSARIEQYRSFPIEEEKRMIIAKLNERVRTTPHRRFMRISAAALILLTAGAGIWLSLRDSTPNGLPEPDRQAVYLQTGNGGSFSLKEHGIISADGIEMINHDGLLSYGEGTEISAVPETHTIIVPAGCRYSMSLSDGTVVIFNAGSQMSYPSVFAGDTREVYLEGEAFFEVAKTDRPFIVHGGGVTVRVTGTSFNVMAYADEEVAEVTLATGEVVVSLDGNPDVSAALHPGQQARHTGGSDEITVSEVDPAKYTGWMDGIFVFDQESLSSIMRKLCRWYGVEIVIESPEIASSRYFGIMDMNAGIKEILGMMAKTKHLSYEIEDNHIIIRKL